MVMVSGKMSKLKAKFVQDDDTWALDFADGMNVRLSYPLRLSEIVEKAVKAQVEAFIIELGHAKNIDTLGLQFLLDIQQEFSPRDIPVVLRIPNVFTRHLLRVLHFDYIFEIEDITCE